MFIVLSLNLVSASNVSLIRNQVWSSNLSGVFYGSLAFGDFDNDGDSDLIGMGCLTGSFTNCASADKIRVYINNGTTLLENSTWRSNTTNLGYGSLALGDIDNDGDLDLVVMGDQGGGEGIIKVYINNGTMFNDNSVWENNFTSINAFNGAIALGDINNDGYLDLALAGANSSTNNGIYTNNGTTFVKNSSWLESLPLVGYGAGGAALIFADFNDDMYLDLAFAGNLNTNFYTSVYINNGSSLIENASWKGDFTETFGFPSLAIDLTAMGAQAGDYQKIYNNTGKNFTLHQENSGDSTLGGYLEGSTAFGDFDNDGDLDLASMGRESGRDKIFTNNNTIFEADIFEQQDMHDDNMEWGGLAWFDINGDNNLDLAINGYDPTRGILNFTIYISNASLTKNNTLPTPPTTFSSNYSNTLLNLTWGSGSDSETPALGLYYNLMVGNSTKNNTIVSGVYGGSSNPTAGYFGNMMQRKNISLNVDLPDGIYYWYVQTIDTGLAKSSWSARQSFTVGGSSDITPPIISSVSASVVASSTATIIWTTNEASNSSVHYGKTTAVSSESDSATLTSSHSISLSGLSASTLYYYNVSSCDASNNCNSSSQRNFTTSAAPINPPDEGGSSGGGSTTPKKSVWTETYPVSDEELINGFSKELSVKHRLQISIDNETHYVGISELTNLTATINISSEPQIATLSIGDTRRFEITGDNYYDINVTLNSINSSSNKANITIISTHEEVTAQTIAEEQAKETTAEEKKKEDIWNERKLWFYLIVGFVMILIITVIIFLIKNIKRRENGRSKNK